MNTSRLAVCSWSLQPRNPTDLLGILKQLDISRTQLALSPTIGQPGQWGGAIQTLRGAGVEIVSGMMAMAGEDYSTLQTIARTGGVRPDDGWPANRNHALAVADLADSADIRLVTFHAGFIPDDPADPERAKLIDRLRTIADAFAERGLRLGLETGQETADTLLDALADLDRPNLGVNFDPANMILYGKGDPVAALRMLAPHIVQIHIKDALPADTPGRWGSEVPVGSGAVDWPAFFEVALAIDPPVDFVIEREAGADRPADVDAARNLIVTHLER
jgi:L-ribulose-5-phosphate 3-epimerase